MEAFTGRYHLSIEGQELIIELTMQNDHLKGEQLWDDLTFEIYPESENHFFNMEDGVSFVFEENPDGILEMKVYEFGQEYSFLKI